MPKRFTSIAISFFTAWNLILGSLVTSPAAAQSLPAAEPSLKTNVKEKLAEVIGAFQQNIDSADEHQKDDLAEIARKRVAGSDEMRSAFIESLKKLQLTETQAQHLDAAVEIRALIRAADEKQQDLPKIQTAKSAVPIVQNYETQLASANAGSAQQEKTVRANYQKLVDKEKSATVGKLRAMLADESANGDLDAALAIRDRIDFVQAFSNNTRTDPYSLRRPATAPSSDPRQLVIQPNELIGTLLGRRSGLVDGVFILKDHDLLGTSMAYSVPVAFKIVAQTNSTNLRLRYIVDQIIFNWEDNPAELRIDGGPISGRHKAGAGLIPTDQWVTIDLIVKNDLVVIRVDGSERYRQTADFSNMADRLCIFTAKGATIKVRSVQVSKP